LVIHDTAVVLAGQQFFFTPGFVSFSFDGKDSYLPELSSFIGTGTTQVDLRISGVGGTFSVPLTTGSITYDYTATTTVPEPGRMWAAFVGLLALFLRRLVAQDGQAGLGLETRA
jgi:hypothetical protein